MIPHELYTKEITQYISHIVDWINPEDFDSLDELHKDKLVSMGIKALKYDVEVILNDLAIVHLVNYLSSYEKDSEYDFIDSIKKSSHESLSNCFNEMIDEYKTEKQAAIYRFNGFDLCEDRVTGEKEWRKVG